MSLASSLQVCIDMDSTTSDQHHHWLQATMQENTLMNSSSSSPRTDMLGPSQILMSEQRRLRPPQDQALKCPRCDSTHTKFCYYNNYSLSQPRYFCKTCRRYWTKGGTLRNIPVGGGYRKNRKSSSSNKKLTTNNETLSVTSSSIINNVQSPSPSPSAMMMMSLAANPVDLQLSFPFSQLHNNMMISSGYNIGGVHDYMERESTVFDKSILMNQDMMSSSRLIRPTDSLCMGYKQHDVVEGVVAMNENMMSKSNNYEGYLSSTTQFAGGYDMHQNKVSFADHLGRLSSCYIDENNNNNTNDSVAQYHVAADEYYSGGLLHEHQQHHHNKDIMTQCEAKPNPKRLGLEWQQEALGCPDVNRFNSKEETFGGHDVGGSWWGSMSSNAGNIYQHHQLLLPSATNSNNSLH